MNKQKSKYFYTASLFDEALIYLLNKKEIEYITVREICDKAGLNRSTFYLHYDSIYDLLNETIKYIDKKFTSKFPTTIFDKNIETVNIKDLMFINDEYLTPYLEFVRENKNIYLANFNYPGNMNTHKRKSDLDNNILKPILRRFNIEEDEMDYYISFYIYGVSSIVENWVINNCNDSIDKIIKIIKKCVRANEEEYK